MSKTRLKELRESRNLSQDQLGKAIGVNQRTISQYETGKNEPDIDTIKKLCEFFDVTTDYFLRVTEV